MGELLNATDLVERLTAAPLDELRVLHGRITDAERLARAIIREKEALARRDARLRSRGLSIVGGEV